MLILKLLVSGWNAMSISRFMLLIGPNWVLPQEQLFPILCLEDNGGKK